jgi:hypothetical protein
MDMPSSQHTRRRAESSSTFAWLFAQAAEQPQCFRLSCGQCGPPYAVRVPFEPQESATIEACYAFVLRGGGSRTCKHHKIDFLTMRQRLPDGSERDVFRERVSDQVLVGSSGGGSVRASALPCPHSYPPPAM